MLKGSGPELRKPVRQTIREIAYDRTRSITARVSPMDKYLVHACIIGRTGGIEYCNTTFASAARPSVSGSAVSMTRRWPTSYVRP